MLNLKNLLPYCLGLLSGFLNGLLGAGGGMIIVPSLVKSGMPQKNAHANSVCIILAICITSSIIYINSGTVSLNDALPYMPWGIFGALLGTFILSRINHNLLRKLFGCFSLWAAYRMLSK